MILVNVYRMALQFQLGRSKPVLMGWKPFFFDGFDV